MTDLLQKSFYLKVIVIGSMTVFRRLCDWHGANLLCQMRLHNLAHLAAIGAQPGCLNLCLHGFHGDAHVFRSEGLPGERFFNQLFDLFLAGCLGHIGFDQRNLA